MGYPMKLEEPDHNGEDEEVEVLRPVPGDVIGDTAYSERFVLRILLKLANLNTLREEIQETTFEEELCTLWDMAAEPDVVIFLLEHDFLNLVNFALPTIEVSRLMEIIIGIIGNMCCRREAANALLMKESFLTSLLEYIRSDDSMILIQILRLVSSCLYRALTNDQDLSKWMRIFEGLEYSRPLYFILKNSSNKDVLVAALENFNTISSYFYTERFRSDYFNNFVNVEALESLAAAFAEVTVAQRDICETDELERVHVIVMQITLNLIGFETASEIFADSKQEVLKIVTIVLSYYEDKLLNQHEIDISLIDIIESTNMVAHIMALTEVIEPEQYFSLSYNNWKAFNSIIDKKGDRFDDASKQLSDFATEVKGPLSILICGYLERCPEDEFIKALDVLGSEYDAIIDAITDEELKTSITTRAANHRNRLADGVDS